MATAMAAVDGSSSPQIFCAAVRSMPSFMQASVWLASFSIESDCRARTESGSMMRRITTTMENVNTMPASTMTATLRYGTAIDHSSTRPDRAVMVNMNISRVKKRGNVDFEPFVSSCMVPPALLNRPKRRAWDYQPSIPNSFSTRMTAATIRKPPKMKRRTTSGTTRTRRAPMIAPGIEPITMAMPAM